MLTRWGAKLLQRIALARARLLALPRSSPVAAAVLGSRAVTGATWLEHAAEVVTHLQVQVDFCADRLGEAERACPVARKRAVRQWKHTALLPAVRAQEQAWFLLQLAALNNEGLIPYTDLLPLRPPLSPGLRWAPWGASLWRCFRAWSLARVTGRVPADLWWPEHSRYEAQACPVCQAELGAPAASGTGLGHLLEACAPLQGLQEACCGPGRAGGSRWALTDTLDVGELAGKCRWVGLAARTWVWHARAAGLLQSAPYRHEGSDLR